jgi:hypothetical protein
MSILRIYPTKSNCIASGAYQAFNSGQNEVTELWYGGGGTDTAPQKRNSISRFIIDFDFTDLQNKLSDFSINPSGITSYRLKMKNAIPRDRVLEPEFEYDRLNKAISASFDLICFPINKSWDEGRGHDLFKDFFVVQQKGNPIISGYSNWNFATSTTAWDAPGVYIDPTGSTAVTNYSTQHFDIGDEDIDMDITNIVNNILSGGSINYGIGVSYRRDYELLSTNTRYVASFFTEKTNTSYKPYIEVSYNQVIKDDRHQVTNNRTSRLFLYTFSGNDSVNFFSSATVNIQTLNNVNIITGLTPVQLAKGVYYVDVLMNSAIRGQKYKDVWSAVTFMPGIDQQDYVQTFQIQDNYYFNNAPRVNAYSLTTYGIDNDSIISNDEITRVFIDITVNYSRKAPDTAYDLQYRMVMNSQDEVIPWTSVNQIILNNCPTSYFELDSSWLLHNQTYEIEFKMRELGTSRILSERIKFRVLRKF